MATHSERRGEEGAPIAARGGSFLSVEDAARAIHLVRRVAGGPADAADLANILAGLVAKGAIACEEAIDTVTDALKVAPPGRPQCGPRSSPDLASGA